MEHHRETVWRDRGSRLADGRKMDTRWIGRFGTTSSGTVDQVSDDEVTPLGNGSWLCFPVPASVGDQLLVR
jgi:hypothetical protein